MFWETLDPVIGMMHSFTRDEAQYTFRFFFFLQVREININSLICI